MKSPEEIGAAALATLAIANEQRKQAGDVLRAQVEAVLLENPGISAKAVEWELKQRIKLRRVQQIMREIKLRSAVGVSQ